MSTVCRFAHITVNEFLHQCNINLGKGVNDGKNLVTVVKERPETKQVTAEQKIIASFKPLHNTMRSLIFTTLLLSFSFCHGHGLFLRFFGFFRSVEDLFTSAYNTGSQAVTQEANQ